MKYQQARRTQSTGRKPPPTILKGKIKHQRIGRNLPPAIGRRVTPPKAKQRGIPAGGRRKKGGSALAPFIRRY